MQLAAENAVLVESFVPMLPAGHKIGNVRIPGFVVFCLFLANYEKPDICIFVFRKFLVK